MINACLGIRPFRDELIELIGIFVCVCGVICMIMDPKASRVEVIEGESNYTYFDLFFYFVLDLVAALFGAGYFLISARNVKIFPVFSVFTLLIFYNILSFFSNGLIGKLFDSQVQLFSTDIYYGCFGFMNKKVAFLAFVPYGLFASVFGSAGYVIKINLWLCNGDGILFPGSCSKY